LNRIRLAVRLVQAFWDTPLREVSAAVKLDGAATKLGMIWYINTQPQIESAGL